MAADGPAAAFPGASAPSRPWGPAWCGLPWTPWVPLERGAIQETAPTLPGVYWVRREGAPEGRLVCVGQTGRTLRGRFLSLAAGANPAECPFNAPYTAAPHLWLLR